MQNQELFFKEIRLDYKKKHGKCLNAKDEWMEKKLAELRIDIEKITEHDRQKECERITELLHIQDEALHEKDVVKKYQLLVKTLPEDFKRNFPDTLRCHNDYTAWLINRRKDTAREMKHAFKSLRIMLSNMEKEIADYSDIELAELIQKECFTSITRQHAIWFLKYIHNKEPEKLKFNMEMSLLRRETLRTENEFYTPEEWRAFAENFFDAERHLERACGNGTYARYWLYALLHMSLAWRKSDILNIPALENIPEFSRHMPNLRSGILFSAAEAQGIVNQAKLSAEQYHTRKTGAKKHFNIPQVALIPTAAALVICEQWRRENGRGALFEKFNVSAVKMKEMLELEEEFLSMKANRTLLSMFNETAADMDGLSGKAETLTSYMRSHKASKEGHADITAVYLRSTYDERESFSMGKQNIDRGLFGWLYDRLLDMAGCRQGSFKENTELIVRMKEALSPQKAEGIAGALYGLLKERDALLDELYSWHEDEIKAKTSLLLSGKLLSRVDDVYCLRCCMGDGMADGKCPYPTEDKCLLCRYSIPTVFSLALAGDELKRLLMELGKTSEKDRIDRMKLTYQIGKLIATVKEASEKFGREYVETYVDFGEINMMLKTQTQKMIFVEEKKNDR